VQDLLPEFKGYLQKNKNASASTLDSYLRDVSQFTESFTALRIKNIAVVEKTDIEKYIKILNEKGRSDSTVTRNIASIRCYFGFLESIGKINNNPAKNVKLKKVIKKMPEILTSKEIDLLLSQPDKFLPKGIRDAAMLELLYATGIRVSELIEINVSDINLSGGVLICRSQSSSRIIPIYEEAIASIAKYVKNARNLMSTDNSGQALFVNMNGSRLTRQGFWKIIKKYSLEAGIKKDITPHTLRHSFALHLLENGAQLKDIQEMLGHTDIASTQIYAAMLNDRFKSVYNKFHPKAK